MVYRGELDYIRTIEPENESRWQSAMYSHLKQWTADLDRMWVIEHDGEALGYCFWEIDQDQAVLASIFVTRERRQTGLGRLLLDQYMADAQARGFTRLVLSVYPNNPAHFLYESAGFRSTPGSGEYLNYAFVLSDAAGDA